VTSISIWHGIRARGGHRYDERVRLATYQSCSFSEKRAVLRAFWSNREDESDKVNLAAREYGPYALAMVAVIAMEFAVISSVLGARGSAWAWAAFVATAFALWSLWRTYVCQRARRAGVARS
jgi:hypothetical protein